MIISDELKKRIRNAEVLGKVCTPKEAAGFIKPDMTLGVSGFGLSGYTKVVAKELAARAEAGERLNLTVYSGASTGPAHQQYGQMGTEQLPESYRCGTGGGCGNR